MASKKKSSTKGASTAATETTSTTKPTSTTTSTTSTTATTSTASNYELSAELRKFQDRGKQMGLDDSEIRDFLDSKKKRSPAVVVKAKLLIRNHVLRKEHRRRKKYMFSALIFIVIAYFLSPRIPKVTEYLYDTFLAEPCLITTSEVFTEMLRSAVPCAICENLTKIDVVHNISKEEFLRKYAFTGVPVLVKDAISDWKALETFSYHYIKDLYVSSADGALDYMKENCQFFGYRTEFSELNEVFEMADDRADLKEGTKPWYIGWSNCDAHSDVGKELRKQYSRPYFLPDDTAELDMDWLFMGGPGNGANMHIDSVERPSWQAQISGTKTWTLEPSPECSSVCRTMEVTMEKGDIIVVNTNMWYHMTVVNKGDISISIGAEYD